MCLLQPNEGLGRGQSKVEERLAVLSAMKQEGPRLVCLSALFLVHCFGHHPIIHPAVTKIIDWRKS